MNKIIIGVVVIAIVAIGSYFFFTNNQQISKTPVNTETTNETEIATEPAVQEQNVPAAEIVIIYTNDGFAPQEITIKNGTTVTFKNESSEAMEVSSGPHPTHDNYPEFDSKRGYNHGESYVFMFTKTGAWGYHNHLNATKFGKVIVE